MKRLYRQHGAIVLVTFAAIFANVQRHDWTAGFMAATVACWWGSRASEWLVNRWLRKQR